MNKILLAAVSSLAVAFAAQASAADLPIKTPAPMAVPASYNWNGFYVGGSLGVAEHQNNATDQIGDAPVYNPTGATSNTASALGFLAGVNAGYNWQVSSNVVVGVETDISYDFAKNNTQWNNYDWYPPNAPWSVNPQALGTVRARLGYAADRALFYVTGGFAYGDPNATVALTSSGTPQYSWTSNGWRTGYAVGGGVEYALSHTVTARVEGLYYNLGSTTVSDSLGSGDTFTFKDSGLLVRAGLNLKLGGY